MKDKKDEKTGDIGNNLQFLYLISLQWDRIQELMARAIIEQKWVLTEPPASYL